MVCLKWANPSSKENKVHSIHINKNYRPESICIGGSPVERIGEAFKTKFYKFLGILVDDQLNWHHHINSLRSKLSSSNFALGNTKSKLSYKARLHIFHSLINSHINYCAPIFSNTKCKELKLLEYLHKKALRHLTLSKYNDHTSILYKKHKLTNFSDTLLLQGATLLHNYRHDRLPDSFSNMFSFKIDTDKNRLRNEDGTFETNSSKFISPLQSAIHFWNRIPIRIREIKTTSIFKNEIKEHFISKYEDFCIKDKCYVCNKTQ